MDNKSFGIGIAVGIAIGIVIMIIISMIIIGIVQYRTIEDICFENTLTSEDYEACVRTLKGNG